MANVIRLDLTNSEREDLEAALREAVAQSWAHEGEEADRCIVIATECPSGTVDLDPPDFELIVGALAEGLNNGLFTHEDENVESEQRAEVVALIMKATRTLANAKVATR